MHRRRARPYSSGKWKQRSDEWSSICSVTKKRYIYWFGLVGREDWSENELFEKFII